MSRDLWFIALSGLLMIGGLNGLAYYRKNPELANSGLMRNLSRGLVLASSLMAIVGVILAVRHRP